MADCWQLAVRPWYSQRGQRGLNQNGGDEDRECQIHGGEGCQTLNPEIKLRFRELRAVLGTTVCPKPSVHMRLLPDKWGFQASLRLR